MKKLLTLLLLFAAIGVHAQDVILKKDGSTIICKVLEIGVSEIKYKKVDNSEGPNYSILRTDVQAINYENGEKEIINNQLDDLSVTMNNDINLRDRYLHNARTWQTIGGIYFWANVLAGGTIALIHGEYNADFAYIMGGALLEGVIGMFIFNEIGRSFEKKANSLLTANQLFRKDFKLGNTNFTAGLDIIHNKATNDKNFGLVIGINL